MPATDKSKFAVTLACLLGILTLSITGCSQYKPAGPADTPAAADPATGGAEKGIRNQ